MFSSSSCLFPLLCSHQSPLLPHSFVLIFISYTHTWFYIYRKSRNHIWERTRYLSFWDLQLSETGLILSLVSLCVCEADMELQLFHINAPMLWTLSEECCDVCESCRTCLREHHLILQTAETAVLKKAPQTGCVLFRGLTPLTRKLPHYHGVITLCNTGRAPEKRM